MGLLILYPVDNGIGILTPMTIEMSVSDIALRDVPEGKPFIIVDHTELPDETFREAWTADFKTPDGHGLGREKFEIAAANRKRQEEDDARKAALKLAPKKISKVSVPEPPKPARSKRKKVKSDD